jgi:hypothetical protein
MRPVIKEKYILLTNENKALGVVNIGIARAVI